MSAARTPGPWHIGPDCEWILGPDGEPVTGEANTALAIAAPDLLAAMYEAEAALEVAMARLKQHKPASYAFHVTSEHLGLQIVRAAIAKATGAAS